MNRKAAVVVTSDGVVAGTREDTSGPRAVEMLREIGFDCPEPIVVADEREEIAAMLGRLAGEGVALVVTSGGTGFAPRDVTPEATASVLDREAPGMAEAVRAGSPVPYGQLSRGRAGLCGRTLIVNLPGSRGGVQDGLRILQDALVHAVELATGESSHHPSPRGT